MIVRFVDSMDDVDAQAWDALHPYGTARNLCEDPQVQELPYPFIRHAFLSALEESGSVGPKQGWLPQHLLCFDDNNQMLLGAMPLYIKGHSYGEYVFDWAWADAYERAGGRYYPKALGAIPFTPATGPRVLVRPGDKKDEVLAAMVLATQELIQTQRLSSHHLLFAETPLGRALCAQGYHQREDTHFQWHDRGYRSFEDFLQAFSSRKRKNVRKEREQVKAHGVTVRMLDGESLQAKHWQAFYGFYRQTYLKRSGHTGYLTRAFFEQIASSMQAHAVMAMAERDGKDIAAALFFKDAKTLYGRYWGSVEDVPGLHFECCYYQGIEYCLAKGLGRLDPGVQGAHKIARGFEPTATFSYHRFLDPGFDAAIANYLEREAQEVQMQRQMLKGRLPFREVNS